MTKTSLPKIIGDCCDFVGADKRQRYAFQCPQCDNDQIFFPTLENLAGPAVCEACRYQTTGEEIERLLLAQEADYQRRQNTRMLRILEYVGNRVPVDGEKQ